MKIESKNTTNVRFSVISDLTENILNETVRSVIKYYQMQKKVEILKGGTGERTYIIWESQSIKADCWFYNMIFFENHCRVSPPNSLFAKKDSHFSSLRDFLFSTKILSILDLSVAAGGSDRTLLIHALLILQIFFPFHIIRFLFRVSLYRSTNQARLLHRNIKVYHLFQFKWTEGPFLSKPQMSNMCFLGVIQILKIG